MRWSGGGASTSDACQAHPPEDDDAGIARAWGRSGEGRAPAAGDVLHRVEQKPSRRFMYLVVALPGHLGVLVRAAWPAMAPGEARVGGGIGARTAVKPKTTGSLIRAEASGCVWHA